MDVPFVVASESAVPDMVGWALAHPDILGPGLEVIAHGWPLPDDRKIPMLATTEEKVPAVVDVMEGSEDEVLARLAGIVGLLRRRSGWLSQSFPDREVRWGQPPRLILLGARYAPAFVQALEGLAISEFVLLRIRSLVSTSGSRLLLVEREAAPGHAAPAKGTPLGLTEEEEKFFLALESERRAVLSPSSESNQRPQPKVSGAAT